MFIYNERRGVLHPVSLFLVQDQLHMQSLKNLLYVTLKWALRDRIFHAVLGVEVVLFLLVPTFSLFSMRQIQELSITLSLSIISFTLLILATLLGASTVWRDIERRYAASVLTLPAPRSAFIIGKFAGTAIILLFTAVSLGLVSALAIKISSLQYPSELSINWLNIFSSVFTDALKYILLAALATFFSTISTSFFLPIFGTISAYLAGNVSQEVFEYITGNSAHSIHPLFRILVRGLYYILPNFSAFNLKVNAIYGLPISFYGLALTVIYFIVYTSIVLTLSIIIFKRRELP